MYRRYVAAEEVISVYIQLWRVVAWGLGEGGAMTKCFICGVGCLVESSLGPHLDRRKGIEGQWNLATCDYCGVDSINPRPSEQELNSFYGAYYENDGLLLQPSRYDSVPALRTLYHLFTGDVDPRDFIKPSDSRILDYGCGGASIYNTFTTRVTKSLEPMLQETW